MNKKENIKKVSELIKPSKIELTDEPGIYAF